MTSSRLLVELLQAGQADDPALCAPGRREMTFGELRSHVDRIRRQLAARDIGRGDRVGIVLPNGPEMASAFLAVSCGASAAPLNPAYTESEFAFYLGDLKPKLVVAPGDGTNPVVAVAAKLAIPVVHVRADPLAPAGAFSLWPEETDAAETSPDDEALVLHTSGTTSRPKVVPLTQGNLCASAHSISRTLALTPADRCLNIMPLFHIHGLVAVVLTSVAAGASTYCTPGFNAMKFFEWASDSGSTWYSGVPTMHQAILARAQRGISPGRKHRFRFVRSSSAALPGSVWRALGETFGCPVIEAYGMTEAAHQMASNPLAAGLQRAGTVGPPAGPEIRIFTSHGDPVSGGQVGEVCIRGDNVMKAYENNDKANRESFFGDWFRTGDQGYFDDDGYLKITGRIKEIINRGGEKISPLEVEEVLIDHPSVQQVVVFGVPHEKLGEDVVAAVVVADGSRVSEEELKRHASGHLAKAKIPRTILFLDEIPKGATGKVQRVKLAEQLGLGGMG